MSEGGDDSGPRTQSRDAKAQTRQHLAQRRLQSRRVTRGSNPAQRTLSPRTGRRLELDPALDPVLRRGVEAVEIGQAQGAGGPRRVPPARHRNGFPKLAGRGALRADHLGEAALRSGAERVDVARQQAPPGSRFAQDQQRHVGQLRIEGAKQLRDLEVGEPTRKSLIQRVPKRAQRQRQRLGSTAQRSRSDGSAKQPDVGRIPHDLGLQTVEQAPRIRYARGLRQQDPLGIGKPPTRPVGELEFGLEVLGESQNHDIGGGRGVESGIFRSPQERIFPGGRQAGQGGSELRRAMNDPEHGQMGFQFFSSDSVGDSARYTRYRRRARTGRPARMETCPETTWASPVPTGSDRKFVGRIVANRSGPRRNRLGRRRGSGSLVLWEWCTHAVKLGKEVPSGSSRPSS